MKVKRTGIQNYMPDGDAHMKLMVIGGPGVGKTRWSSGWPEPIYLDVEAGLASVADLNVPYIEIGVEEGSTTSQDMLDALRWLKSHPDAKRYGTVIVDTLDAYQRKVKQEWLDANPNASAFTGYDAWGFLDSKMQMLMTRLLSLPMNVVVLVHYKDKTVSEKDGSNTVERTIFSLQLQGSAKDEVFNDFDLIGWMGSYWKPGDEGEGRVEARGLTFSPTPQKPFLKDRLHIAPTYLEVSLETDDLYDNYANLFKRFTDRLDELEDAEDVGEVERVDDDGNPITDGGVVSPMKGGAAEPQDPKDMPLNDLTKAELIKMGRGMPSIADEIKTSLLKAEVVELVEKGRKIEAEQAESGSEKDSETDPEDADQADEGEASSASPDDAAEEGDEDSNEDSTPVDDDEVDDTPDDDTDQADGEPQEDSSDATDTPEDEVASDEEDADTEGEDEAQDESSDDSPDEAAEDEDDESTCSVCGKSLSGENEDYVKLGWIKFREPLCNEHYLERKKKG